MKTLITSTCMAILLLTPSLAAPGPLSSIERSNNLLINQQIREFGFDPERLNSEQREQIETSFHLLRPGDHFGRYPLNTAQATAIVYLALQHGQKAPRPASNLLKLVYDLEGAVPEEQFKLFLSSSEERKIKDVATLIQNSAIEQGCTEVADLAIELRDKTRGVNTSRTLVRDTIKALKTAVKNCR